VTGVRVVVIGGGISGLAAAWRLSKSATAQRPIEVIVLEAAAETGGKLRLASVAGLTVDVGAESVLARRPEALQLMEEVGLSGDVVRPQPGSASVLARGELHRLPAGTVMGVPTDRVAVSNLSGLLTEVEVARAEKEQVPASVPTDDVSVGSWVASRLGRPVVDRLVEPLLGGVYAGHADELSLRATVPALWQRARTGEPLLSEPTAVTGPTAVAGPTAVGSHPETGSAGAGATGPVFAGLRGGVGRLPITLVQRLRADGVEVRTSTTVRGLRRTATGWRLETGPAGAPAYLEADAVILAVPPAAASRLLAADCPAASAELAQIETASVAVVAAAVPRGQLTGVTGTGLLIPPVERRLIKAATFSSAKWAWVSDEARSQWRIVRLSIGRAREEASLQRPDDELAALAVGELATILGRAIQPVESTVIRWGGGLPQYAVGHLDRIRRIRASVAAVGALAVCGAALDGVGVPACIAAADRAVTDLGVEALERAGTIGA
jgi:oxygen-dependent protoporphyrinogen oxidase